jgi:hypothetical protein
VQSSNDEEVDAEELVNDSTVSDVSSDETPVVDFE